VGVESATAPDGAPVARVRVRLDRAATHRVRSARNTILVELDRNGASTSDGFMPAKATTPTIGPAAPAIKAAPEPAPAKGAVAEKRAAATQLRSVRFAKIEDGYSVTLTGNGPLLAASVEEVKDLPPRVLLDFHGVSTGSAAAVTNVKNDDVDRIRVATNSRTPLVTRVVIDLARRLPYTVEQIGDDLRVMFKRAADAAVAAITPASAPEKIE